MKLHATRFGIAFGIVYAVMFLLWGLLAALFGWGGAMAEMVGGFYIGFGPSLAGAVIGAIWGFVVGFAFFAVAAAIYNRLGGGD